MMSPGKGKALNDQTQINTLNHPNTEYELKYPRGHLTSSQTHNKLVLFSTITHPPENVVYDMRNVVIVDQLY